MLAEGGTRKGLRPHPARLVGYWLIRCLTAYFVAFALSFVVIVAGLASAGDGPGTRAGNAAEAAAGIGIILAYLVSHLLIGRTGADYAYRRDIDPESWRRAAVWSSGIMLLLVAISNLGLVPLAAMAIALLFFGLKRRTRHLKASAPPADPLTSAST